MFNIDKSLAKIIGKKTTSKSVTKPLFKPMKAMNFSMNGILGNTRKMNIPKLNMPKMAMPKISMPTLKPFKINPFSKTNQKSQVIMNKNKNKSYAQLKNKYDINPLLDNDKDGVMNYKDCRPFDKKKHYLGIFKRGKDYTWDEDNPQYMDKLEREPKYHREIVEAFRYEDPKLMSDMNQVRVRSKKHLMGSGGKIEVGVNDAIEFRDKIQNSEYFRNFHDALKDHLRKHGNPEDKIYAEFSDEQLGYVKDFVSQPVKKEPVIIRQLTPEEERIRLVKTAQRLQREQEEKEEELIVERQKKEWRLKYDQEQLEKAEQQAEQEKLLSEEAEEARQVQSEKLLAKGAEEAQQEDNAREIRRVEREQQDAIRQDAERQVAEEVKAMQKQAELEVEQ